MVQCKRILLLAAAVIVCLLPEASVSFAESANQLVKNGNRAYGEERFDDAVSAYEKALEKAPSALIEYNKGAALYKKGDYAEALTAFERAAAGTEESDLAARSRFNMGNTYHKRAGQNVEKEPQKALDDLKESLVNYRQALEISPDLAQAARNMEVTKLNIRRVEEILKKQQQQAAGDKREKDEAGEALDKLINRQQQLTEKSREQEKRTENDQTESTARQQASEQQKLTEETGQLAEEMERKGSNSEAFKQAGDNLRQALEEQKEAEERLSEGQFGDAAESQEKAAENLKKARQALQDKKSGDDASPQEGQPESGEESGKDDALEQESLTAQNAQEQEDSQAVENGRQDAPSENARDILEKERENRMMRQRKSLRISPVDKDW